MTDKWNREELYRGVWQEPMLKLAPKYGISSVMLGKVCRKLRIPVPGRGYWARKESGYSVSIKPLPKLKDVPVVQRLKFPDPYPKEPKMPEPEPTDLEYIRIKEVESLEIPIDPNVPLHRLVAATAKVFKSGQTDVRGYRSTRGHEGVLDLHISNGTSGRAIQILNTVVLALEKQGLVVELAKSNAEFDFETAKQQMTKIARGISEWPHQWSRETKERGQKPLWRVRGDSIRRIAALAKSSPDRLLPPQVDARIVLCELLNVFPSLAFPNPPEMHSYIRFGIRPLLYSILRREFLQPREVGVCANTQCRDFFEVHRAGQRYCDNECSRSQRQREYWRDQGKTARKERLASRSKSRNLKSLAAECPGAGRVLAED
jgi:hypothetical protein